MTDQHFFSYLLLVFRLFGVIAALLVQLHDCTRKAENKLKWKWRQSVTKWRIISFARHSFSVGSRLAGCLHYIFVFVLCSVRNLFYDSFNEKQLLLKVIIFSVFVRQYFQIFGSVKSWFVMIRRYGKVEEYKYVDVISDFDGSSQ